MKHIADIEWRAGLTLREISRMAPEVLQDHFQAWSKRNAPKPSSPHNSEPPTRSRSRGFEG